MVYFSANKFVDAQNYSTTRNSKLYVKPLCLFYFAVKLGEKLFNPEVLR